MGKPGRKPKYDYWLTEDGLVSIEGWARDGRTDEQIARTMGIAPQTLCEWKNRFPELDEALRRGHAPVDTYVENALLTAAKNGNITAMIFWLKNRKRTAWRDAWREDSAEDKSITIKLDNSVKEYSK